MPACLNCGKEFVKTGNNQKYCCKHCADYVNKMYMRDYSRAYRRGEKYEKKQEKMVIILGCGSNGSTQV